MRASLLLTYPSTTKVNPSSFFVSHLKGLALMAKDKKPKVETRRGLTPVGMASFPNLFTPKKINQNDPKEEPKFRLTHVYKVAEFNESNRTAFNTLVENVNEVCRLEILKTFEDDMIAAFEAALAEHADKSLRAHYAAFKCLTWFDKKEQLTRSCRSPFLLGKNDDYVDDAAIFIRSPDLALNGDESDVGIGGVDFNLRNLTAFSQAGVFPGLACIS